MQHTPNLAITPDADGGGFDALVATVKKGVAVLSLSVNMDQQRLNGTGYGVMREIVNGKLGRFIRGGALVFRAPELWKNLTALGGQHAQQWVGFRRGKGQPWQRTTHSVGGVPGIITELAVVDATRKAT
jgi:predicted Zn-dependent protease